jgi:xylulokinase
MMGIDIGTSSTRVLVISTEGQMLAVGKKEYSFDIPQEGYAEQDPEIWWNAVKDSCKAVLDTNKFRKENIRAISFSGQMHGLVPLSRNAKCIRKAILWSDQRSKKQVQRIENEIGLALLGRITKNRIATGFLLPSLLWMQENEPEEYALIYKVILPKDYIRLKMTGNIASEFTDAAATGAYDCTKNKWSSEILLKLNINPELFPKLGKTTDIAGVLTKHAAEDLGLVSGIPVIFGGGDQVMQSIGNGVIRPGIALVTIGTSGQIFMPEDQPVYDLQLRTHCFPFVNDRYYFMGATLAAGLSLKWLKNVFSARENYQEIDEKVKNIKPGAEGLIFLPYLSGERSPHMDSMARGMFFGTVLNHTCYHFYRAVMEGVVFALKDCMEILQYDLYQNVEKVIASGGGSQSSVWLQIEADILGCEIFTSEMKEQSGVGAAITAGVGAHLFSDFDEAIKQIIHWNEKPILPIAKNVERYQEYYKIYRALYPTNRNLMHQLSSLN